MKLLIDEDVPRSVSDFLIARQHEVYLVREDLARESSDTLIASVADERRLTVVTWNARDFRKLMHRRQPATGSRYRRAGWIIFKCRHDQGRARIERVIDALELEYTYVQTTPDHRVFIEIGADWYKIFR